MSDPGPGDETQSTLRWQQRLLPFLLLMLGGLTVFFFAISLQQLRELEARIDDAPSLDLEAALRGADLESLAPTDRVVMSQWRARVYLEKNIVERRYHQANVLLMARTWTRYLGFITGMILALVGAAFILAKLRESTAEMGVKTPAGEGSLKGQSPGLFLAFLGTTLMVTTIVAHNAIETSDTATYTNMVINARPAADAAPEPLDTPPAESAAAQDTTSVASRLGRIMQRQPQTDTTRGR